MLTESDFLSAKILIVDDEPAHVHLLERLLQSVGYLNVTSTMDPQQVCRLHREQSFELILLDLQMPVLDGFGVLEALQAEAGTNTVLPVIALTAQPGHKLRALQAGARDFINKPLDVVEVKIRIRHRLEVALLYKLLEAHNQELERTVQERTAALTSGTSAMPCCSARKYIPVPPTTMGSAPAAWAAAISARASFSHSATDPRSAPSSTP
jgi:DNA-binding response OmpR family regulator